MTPRDLTRAAHFIRLLHAVERAHALDDPQTVTTLLWGLDPIELRRLAERLEAVAASGGETIGGLTAAGAKTAPTSASADAVRPRESSVVHIDRHSVKV